MQPTEDNGTQRSTRSTSKLRRTAITGVAIACLAAVVAPLSVSLFSARSSSPRPNAPHAPHVKENKAIHSVISSLSATVDSGSYDIIFSDQPPTQPLGSSSSSACSSSVPAMSCMQANGNGLLVTGEGTVDTDPYAMVATSDVPGIGLVTLRANGTDIWEAGGGNYGLSPGEKDSGPGAPLAGFARLVEGSVGLRQGALDMMGLASPTGYLELEQNAISSANEVGTGVVDGAPVVNYLIQLSPGERADVSGATPQEAAALKAALQILLQQGYT
ncbi:MAG: hypothetical protein ACRD6W_14595, partial [Nitrososphaerales archaeon]